jgi:hypothetical protein
VLLAVVVPLLGPGGPEGPAPAFRGGGTDLVALAPRGAADPVRVLFRWTAVEGARRYRLEVFDAASRRLHQEVVPDTLAAVDTALLAAAGLQEGFWRVTALGEVGAPLAVSAPAPLRLPAQ